MSFTFSDVKSYKLHLIYCIKYYSVDVLLKHDFFGCELHVHVLEKWLESQTIMYRVKKTIMKGTILNNMLLCIEI